MMKTYLPKVEAISGKCMDYVVVAFKLSDLFRSLLEQTVFLRSTIGSPFGQGAEDFFHKCSLLKNTESLYYFSPGGFRA